MNNLPRPRSRRERILEVVKKHPGKSQSAVLRDAGLNIHGAPRQALRKLADEGLIVIVHEESHLSKVYPPKRK